MTDRAPVMCPCGCGQRNVCQCDTCRAFAERMIADRQRIAAALPSTPQHPYAPTPDTRGNP